MLTALLLLAATTLPIPAPDPGSIDLAKVASVLDYDSESLLLVLDARHFAVVQKSVVAASAGHPIRAGDVRMLISAGDVPPIVLSAEWRGNDDNVLYKISLNCATYTSFTVCQDAFDAAVKAMKAAHKPQPATVIVFDK